MAANTQLQVTALTRTYRLLLAEEDITREQLKTKLVTAQGAMEDGVEINALSFEGGSVSGVALYPKEVVMTALLDILEESAEDADPSDIDRSVVHADLSSTRIES